MLMQDSFPIKGDNGHFWDRVKPFKTKTDLTYPRKKVPLQQRFSKFRVCMNHLAGLLLMWIPEPIPRQRQMWAGW